MPNVQNVVRYVKSRQENVIKNVDYKGSVILETYAGNLLLQLEKKWSKTYPTAG